VVDPLIGGTGARAAKLLQLVHDTPGLTRAEASRRLGLGRGAMSELTETLRHALLLDERPAPTVGRGRPTRRLVAHPDGPLVLAAAPWRPLGGRRGEAAGWRVHAIELGGGLVDGCSAADLPAAAAVLAARLGHRIRAAAAAIPADPTTGDAAVAADHPIPGRAASFPITGGTAGGPTTCGPADFAIVGGAVDFPITGREVAFAAAGEARRGAARGAGLHLHVDRGAGACLTLRGRPLGGDPGHLPFGDPATACPCGSTGCWIRGGPATLGRGIAGLVNGFGVDVVTVAGVDAAALTVHYRAALTTARRADPPPILPAALGDDGPLLGAAETAWSALLGR
jgi:hypothetical protein